jgi:hypothetical protein
MCSLLLLGLVLVVVLLDVGILGLLLVVVLLDVGILRFLALLGPEAADCLRHHCPNPHPWSREGLHPAGPRTRPPEIPRYHHDPVLPPTREPTFLSETKRAEKKNGCCF